MITVIIAGGSGTRLWPLSTPEYPKHLLRINGHKKSLLQNTYERAKKISKKIYVVTDKSHAHHVREQLSNLTDDTCIIEPARRGTASCIIAGLDRVSRDNSLDESVAFIAADHYIRDVEGFAHSFRLAQKVSEAEERIVLIGVEPDHPATGFGYIEKGTIFDETSFVFNVKAFKEKPQYAIAQKYVKSGNYLWNCGYFVGSVNTFLKAMEQYAPELRENFKNLQAAKELHEYENIYLGFENIAIDYALIEKVSNLLVIPASFDWMDLGSFTDLHKAVESDERGNHTHGAVEINDVQNSFIQNHSDIPIAVVGLDNVVVVSTKNGFIVARKDMSQAIGDAAKKIHGEKAK